jgi:ankyrin repeat protein
MTKKFNCEISDAYNEGRFEKVADLLLQIKKENINSNIDINSGPITPLNLAIKIGSLDTVKAMIDKGADLNLESETGEYKGFTPLLAAVNNDYGINADIVNALLENGAEVNKTATFGRFEGLSVLYSAAYSRNIGIVTTLLEKGATFGDSSITEFTANNLIGEFLDSEDEDSIKIAKLLLDNIPDLNFSATSPENAMILFRAISLNDSDLVSKLIIHKANVNNMLHLDDHVEDDDEHDDDDFMPLQLALSEEHFDICKILIDAGANVNHINNEDGDTPLIFAARTGNLEGIKLLMKHGANYNIVNKYGKTALMEAAGNQHQACESYLRTVKERLDISKSTLMLQRHIKEKKKIDINDPLKNVSETLAGSPLKTGKTTDKTPKKKI